MTKGRLVPAFLFIDCLVACFAEAERAIFNLVHFSGQRKTAAVARGGSYEKRPEELGGPIS